MASDSFQHQTVAPVQKGAYRVQLTSKSAQDHHADQITLTFLTALAQSITDLEKWRALVRESQKRAFSAQQALDVTFAQIIQTPVLAAEKISSLN